MHDQADLQLTNLAIRNIQLKQKPIQLIQQPLISHLIQIEKIKSTIFQNDIKAKNVPSVSPREMCQQLIKAIENVVDNISEYPWLKEIKSMFVSGEKPSNYEVIIRLQQPENCQKFAETFNNNVKVFALKITFSVVDFELNKLSNEPKNSPAC